MYINLLKQRRFFPMFIVQSFTALNDNILKNSIMIFFTLRLTSEASNSDITFLANASNFLFILPYIIFSGTAGQIADKYIKAYSVRTLKLLEIIIAIIASIGFYFHSFNTLLVTILLMGTQSTFYGTFKYAMIPEYIKTNELLAGNALIESSTFFAVILGSIVGVSSISHSDHIYTISMWLMCIAVFGWLASLAIKPQQIEHKNVRIDINPYKSTRDVFKRCTGNKKLLLVIIGISWFWMLGSFVVSEVPTISNTFKGHPDIISMLYVIFTVGIGIGSLLSTRITVSLEMIKTV